MGLYLDNAATTPLRPDVKQYIIDILDIYGNPSSVHQIGVQGRDIILTARKNVAKFINVDEDEIIFTSSGSAANNLAIIGYLDVNHRNDYNVFYSPIAHKSILKCMDKYGLRAEALKVDNKGIIDFKDLNDKLFHSTKKFLVVIDYANSEIGTVQDVRIITKLVHAYGGIVALDCTGSIPYIPVDVKDLDVDMIMFSGHKLGALKGCGVLYKKKHITLSPLVYGSQEQGLFGGTENVIGIASLSKAVENYNYDSISDEKRLFLWNRLSELVTDIELVGDREHRLPYNLYVCIKEVSGEALAIMLDLNGYCISTGSACNSGSLQASPTLQAIGMDETDQLCCVRITLNGNETYEELIGFSKVFADLVNGLRVIGYGEE